MNEMPEFTKLDDGGCIWSHEFETFTATVYVPTPKKELLSESLNYGFISPYLLVFEEEKLDYEAAVSFAWKKVLKNLPAILLQA